MHYFYQNWGFRTLWVWDMNYFMITIKIIIRIHIPSKIRNKKMQHSRSSKVDNWKFISVGRSYSKRTTIVYWLNNFMSCRDWHFVSHIPLAEIMEGRTHETTKKWHFSDPPRAFRGNQPTVGLKSKNPLKIIFKKIVKLTVYNYACDSLTNIEYETYAMIGNHRSYQRWLDKRIYKTEMNF